MKAIAITVIHGLVGWVLCGAVMGAGLALSTEQTAIAIHAITAPLLFAGVAGIYFRRFAYFGPMQTAAIFIATILLMDIFVVSALIVGNFEMFRSVFGTWLPIGMIFVATWLAGRLLPRRPQRPRR